MLISADRFFQVLFYYFYNVIRTCFFKSQAKPSHMVNGFYDFVLLLLAVHEMEGTSIVFNFQTQ